MAALIGDEKSSGIYNLVAPGVIRNAQFAEAAGAALGRPAWMITPRFVLKGLLGEQATLVCDGQQAVSRRLSHDFEYPEIRGALENLV
jgi:NAD dependent epimerase/dehydratase family enzyme